jgi:Rrf2 family protein
MKLSARSRYASRILLELAQHKEDTPMSATMLSQNTGVSVQFVEQILKPLKQSGLTRSVRGAAGGHRLAKSAEDITLGEVVRLMEGGIMLTVCCKEDANNCPRKDGCLTRAAWMQVSRSLEEELDSISLSKLLHAEQVCSEKRKNSSPPAKAGVRNVAVAKPDARMPPGSLRVIIRKAKEPRFKTAD